MKPPPLEISFEIESLVPQLNFPKVKPTTSNKKLIVPNLEFETVYNAIVHYLKCGKCGVIAGGFLRDTILNKPIKDIDFFVNRYAINESVLADFNLSPDFEYKNTIDVFKILEIKINDIPLQIIVLHSQISVESLLETFDIGLCKIAYKEGVLYRHEDFISDSENKTITIFKGKNTNHIKRVKSKYNDYKVKYELEKET